MRELINGLLIVLVGALLAACLGSWPLARAQTGAAPLDPDTFNTPPLDFQAPLPHGRWTRPIAILAEPTGSPFNAGQALSHPGWRLLVPRDENDWLSADPHWLRIPLRHTGTEPLELWFQIDYPWLRDVRAQVFDLQGRALSRLMRSGSGVPVAERELRTGSPAFPVRLAPGQEAVLMVRTEGVFWWPDRIHWQTAADGSRRVALHTAATALGLGAALILALFMALQRSVAGMATGVWILVTAVSEVAYRGHMALLPWLDPWSVSLATLSEPLVLLSHLALALMTIALLRVHRVVWDGRMAIVAVAVGTLFFSLCWFSSGDYDQAAYLFVYLCHGVGWAALAVALWGGLQRNWVIPAVLALIHLNWLLSHGWPHGYGRFIVDNPEIRLVIKTVLVSLLVLSYTLASARLQRELQQSLLEAQRRQAAELEQQVAQRTHALRQALADANQANRAKSEFISSMSHELRTPMNAILGFSQVIFEDPDTDGFAREGAREILYAGRHLLHLIDDVLDLSKVELNRMEMRLGAVAVGPLAQECRRLLETQAQERRVNTIVEAMDGVMVTADEDRLRQVLLNLLSNAIKYNAVGGWVRVSAEVVGDGRWRLNVRDGGPGIATEVQARLFQPFERGDARFGPVPGTGIGLALSKRLTELMGGRLGLQSTVGAGTRFWVDLPAAPSAGTASSASAPADASPMTDGPGAQDADGAILSATPEGSRQAAQPASIPGKPVAHRLLCIDDKPVNLRLLVRMLQREPDLAVHTCQDPRHALDQALKLQPTAILLDINMPGLNGYDLLRLFREQPTLRQVPVLAVTADAMPHDVDRGREAGFDEYLTKPLDTGALQRALQRHLR